MKKVFAATLAASALLVMSGCSIPSTVSDEILVHKGGGPLDDQGPRGCIAPSTRSFESPFDGYFSYPANQRVYAFNASKDADGAPFTVVSKDGQTLVVSGTMSFSLNTNCEVLQRFHDKIGNRYAAYNVDGQPSEGWNKMLDIYMRPALDSALDRVAKKYSWIQLYSDPSIKDELNAAVNESARNLINQQFEGKDEYFLNYSALIQQPQAAQDLIDLAKAEEVSKRQAANTDAKARADAAAAKSAADAQVSQKEAELKVAQIQAQIKQTEIAAYGGIKDYNNAKAIEKGLNPFQPNYGGGVIVDQKK